MTAKAAQLEDRLDKIESEHAAELDAQKRRVRARARAGRARARC